MSTAHWRTPRSRVTPVLLGIGLMMTGTQLFVPAQGIAPQAADPANATAATAPTAAATTSDWSQGRHDSAHRGWSAAETLIAPANVKTVVEEWTAPGGTPAIAGNVVYVISTEPLGSTGVLTAYDLTTGVVNWQIGTGTCKTGPVSVTATLVILGCGAQPRAYERGDDHGLVWDTTETDPDQTLQNHLILGTKLVAWSQDRVATYRLSDGQRLWQQLLPAGATWIHDVAALGTSVVVAYDDRLRALSAVNGGQLWSKAGVVTSQVVIAVGWVYTNNGNGVSRYSLAAGAPGWSVLAGQDIYRIEAADNDTIYVWNAVFDFGSPSPSVLRALRMTNGSQRWQRNVPSRIGSVAVTGDLVWLTSTEIFSQGRGSDLIALNRLTGAQLKQFHFEDNMYGWTDVAFGAGKAIVHQGGSFGGTTPPTLRVFGLAGRRPTIATRVLPIGRVGSAYSFQLRNVVGTSTWSVQSGALPAGLSLSASGLISGTPTGAQSSTVLVRSTGANARTHEHTFPIMVVASVAPIWQSTGRNATRNPLEPGTGLLDLEDAPSFAFRWKTAAPGAPTYGGDQEVVVRGTVMYSVAWDGVLRAWSTSGSAANRPALWSASPTTGGYVGAPTLSAGKLFVRDDSGLLHAVNASNGAPLWETPDPVAGNYEAPLVVGSSVFVRDQANQIRAFSVANGAPLWSGDPAPVSDVHSALSSDGTRIYAIAQCELYAVNISNGSVAWHTKVVAGNGICSSGSYPPEPPIVLKGKVYATEPEGKMVANAATGAPQVRFPAWGYYRGTSVVVGGVWTFLNENRVVAVDTTTGELNWSSEMSFAAGAKVSATGDLIVVVTDFDVNGVNRLTGATVWDGGGISGVSGSAAVGTRRILVPTQQGVRAFGPL